MRGIFYWHAAIRPVPEDKPSMLHFLHTADWQIGSKFGQFNPDEAALLGEARFETVERIAALAAQKQVQAVLVAGDVFDQQTVSDRVIRRLFAAMSGFAGAWVMIPGNHDAALAESVWSRAAALGCIPPNVHVCVKPGIVALDGGAVLAAPLTQRHTFEDVSAAFDDMQTADGLIRIGLAHGSVAERLPAGIAATNPIAADRCAQARLDYLALGDWHGVFRVDQRTWYSGTPETDRFTNNDSGMLLEVRIAASGAEPEVTPQRIGKYEWRRWDQQLAVASDVDLLAERLAALGARDVLLLQVEGSIDLDGYRRLEQAIEDAAARVRALRHDLSALRFLPTAAELAELGARGGYLAEAVARLRQQQEDPVQRAVATEALLLLARFQQELQ
jgi:DNA repair exonuclease SbcCD nuclease subunit